MNALTVFAHSGLQSFCHAVLDRFDAGLRDAGHANEIVDLYAIGFDPILRPRDTPSWMTETIPDDMLDPRRLLYKIEPQVTVELVALLVHHKACDASPYLSKTQVACAKSLEGAAVRGHHVGVD